MTVFHGAPRKDLWGENVGTGCARKILVFQERGGADPLQARGLLKEARSLWPNVLGSWAALSFLNLGAFFLLFLHWWLKWIPSISQQLSYHNQTLQFESNYEVLVSCLDDAHQHLWSGEGCGVGCYPEPFPLLWTALCFFAVGLSTHHFLSWKFPRGSHFHL